MENIKGFVLICFCPFIIYFSIIELPSVRKRHLCLSQGKMSACFKKCCSSGRHPISEAELQMNNLKTITSVAIWMPNQPYFEFLAQPVS